MRQPGGSFLLGHHVPGTTLLHRLPAGVKLLAVFVAGLVVLVLRGPVSSLVAVAVAVALVIWAGARWRTSLRALRGIALVVVLLGGFTAWQRGGAAAIEAMGDLIALVLVATVLTLTTPIDALLDVVVRLVGPLRRLGVDPERVGLAFALMIRAVPATLDLAAETRQAAAARGLERSPRARLVPLVIRVVARAHETGDALHARGLGD